MPLNQYLRYSLKSLSFYVTKLVFGFYKVLLKSESFINLQSVQRCGNNVYISPHVYFNVKDFEIGNDVYIGRGCIFQSTHGSIRIGNKVMFGPGVHIHGGNHKFSLKDVAMYDQHKRSTDDDGSVNIDDDVWIGANAIILANVNIAKGSVVAAGSIVTSDVPPFSIVAGVPAKVVRLR